MVLDSAAKSLEIVLAEAMTTTDCDITAAYAEVSVAAFTLAGKDLVSNGTTAVTVVSGPMLSGTQRQVKEVTVFNNDTVDHLVTLQVNNGSSVRIIRQWPLAPGGSAAYHV